MPYYIKLPHKFLYWWAIRAPKKAFKMGVFFMSFINNEIAFTMNLGLLFVPLFGIYNFTARIMSFVIRLFMSAFGIIIMGVMLLICVLLPVTWLSLPFLIANYSLLISIIFFIFLYIIWAIFNLDTPDRKISKIKALDQKIKTFRPITKYLLKKIKNEHRSGLAALLNNKKVNNLLTRAELNTNSFKDKLLNSPKITTSDLVDKSFKLAVENKATYVEPEHLFISVIQNIPNIDTLLSTFNSKVEILKQTAFWIVNEWVRASKAFFWQEDFENPTLGGIGKGMIGRVTPNLDKVSTDITKEVKNGRIKNIIGREEEIKKIAEILEGDKNDIMIIGESGIGKTTIIKGIAYKIIHGVDYKTLKNKRIVSLDIGALLSSGEKSENIAEKLTQIVKEVKGSDDIILFIDEIQNLITGMGEESGENSTILSILINHIPEEKMRTVGATSMSNYRKYIEPNEAFSRLFQNIKIDESSEKDTINILKDYCMKKEQKQKVIVTYPALLKCIKLSQKLILDRVLPDKAIDVMERAISSVKNSTRYVTSEKIAEEISEITSIPLTTIDADESEKLLNLSSKMKERVIGKDHAIEKIQSSLQRARTGIRDEKKPIASYLFVGTTGVGKTETAKALSEIFLGKSNNLIRLDMSEYQQIDSMNRIIGTPEGTTAGTFTDKVRNNPYSVILIDEIEKAHPNILLTFLQMLDEGRLTDTAGNECNFTNTIIIATSNVGTRSIQSISETGGSYKDMSEAAMDEIRNKFAPEFLNRFTDIIVFNPLSIDDLRKITNLMLVKVRNYAEEKGIEVKFKPELIDELIKQGYSPEWGARPMAREIEDSVETYLAQKILKKEIKAGDRILLGKEVYNL